jgi:hypothetical protein
MMGQPPAEDRFRIGDIWQSPADLNWEVIRCNPVKGRVSLRRRDPILGLQSKTRDSLAVTGWRRLSWGGMP